MAPCTPPWPPGSNIEYPEPRRGVLDDQITRHAHSATYRTHAETLCCLRGIKTLPAMSLLAGIGAQGKNAYEAAIARPRSIESASQQLDQMLS